MKGLAKTWQVREIRSQQLEHKQVPKGGTESGGLAAYFDLMVHVN